MNTKWFVTWFYVGTLPGAPGTWGSLAALPFAYLLHWQGGPTALIAATLIAYALGHWATHIYLKTANNKDPSEVVVDEVAGQMIALWPLSVGLALAGVPTHSVPWPGWVGAFLIFRLFDIKKPWLVGWAEKLPGAWGVMLDDVIAGIFAAISVLAFAAIAHGWFT